LLNHLALETEHPPTDLGGGPDFRPDYIGTTSQVGAP
jgi:hypothetical protein